MQDRPSYRERAFVCDNDHAFKHFMWASDPDPKCPTCKADVQHGYASNKAACVIQDSIEGGVYIRHGICNEDGSPRRYDSHSDMKREAKARGLLNLVEHVPPKGSDKSIHTSKWIAVDTTNYNDPSVRAARRGQMAAFLGVTPQRYDEITNVTGLASPLVAGRTRTAETISQVVASIR